MITEFSLTMIFSGTPSLKLLVCWSILSIMNLSLSVQVRALPKTYTINSVSIEDTINLLAALGQIRSLLSVRMGREEEKLMIRGLGWEHTILSSSFVRLCSTSRCWFVWALGKWKDVCTEIWNWLSNTWLHNVMNVFRNIPYILHVLYSICIACNSPLPEPVNCSVVFNLFLVLCSDIMNNKVFYQHPNLMRALGMHETVMEVMVNVLSGGDSKVWSMQSLCIEPVCQGVHRNQEKVQLKWITNMWFFYSLHRCD